MAELQQGDARFPCCKVKANLELREDFPIEGGRRQMRVCKVCGRRHFLLDADPIVVGIRGAPIG